MKKYMLLQVHTGDGSVAYTRRDDPAILLRKGKRDYADGRDPWRGVTMPVALVLIETGRVVVDQWHLLAYCRGAEMPTLTDVRGVA